MRYLVFYSMNAQRRTGFRRDDEIRCVPSHWPDYRAERATVIIRGRRKRVNHPVIFDRSTTPPTLLNATITNVAHWSQRHPSFPKFYISPAGHIRESATDKLVMSP